MTYRDRTFCMAACDNLKCDKNWAAEYPRYQQKMANRPSGNPPWEMVTMAILSEDCPDYQPAKKAIAK